MTSFALLVTLCVCLAVVSCTDFGNVEQQNRQENFQREFKLQLDLIENQNVGCLFAKDVCSPDEKCYNDSLFGTCIAVYATETSLDYRLPPSVVKDLKTILTMLVEGNYTWRDKYAQCCVRAGLLCGSMEIAVDLSVCREFVADKSDKSDKEQTTDVREEPSFWGQETKALAPADDRQDQMMPRQAKKLDAAWQDFVEKRLQLLNRHKYEYYFRDSPEKGTDAEDHRGLEDAEMEAAWNAMSRVLGDENGVEPMGNGGVPDSEDSAAPEDNERADEREEAIGEDRSGNLLDAIRPMEDSRELAEAIESKWEKYAQRRQNQQSRQQTPRELTKPQRHDVELKPASSAAASRRPRQKGHSKNGDISQQLLKREDWKPQSGQQTFVDGSYLWIQFKKPSMFEDSAIPRFINRVNKVAGRQVLGERFSVNMTSNEVYFQLTQLASPGDVLNLFANETTASELKADGKFDWKNYGIGRPQNKVEASELSGDIHGAQVTSILLLCGIVLAIIAALFVVFTVQKVRSSQRKLRDLTASPAVGGNADYSDLCRQRMLVKCTEQQEPLSAAAQHMAAARPAVSDSPNSSTGSWSDDPIPTDMDITTGHLILSYMEEYLSNKEKLGEEWASLCSYEADRTDAVAARTEENAAKNRYPDVLPYDHTRVVLHKEQNATTGDYINANYISDSDPKVKSYILTQAPTDATAADFWQMLWENCSVNVVNLTKLKSPDGSQELCSQYWPTEGSRLFNRFEVHLVSEHIWCESFVVRNFYLKNLSTGEARTVTMFHFLSWDETGLPPNPKILLDFRRKVNKSYKGRATPMVIHCNDGVGRTGAYCLLDLALTRINKGVKEIDLAACLEHLRDQRQGLVKTKDQFEFVVTAIAEEVHNVLKTLPQQ